MNEFIVKVARDSGASIERVGSTYESLIATNMREDMAMNELLRAYPPEEKDLKLESIDLLIQKQSSMRDLMRLQKASCLTGDAYMIGLYNGLAVALAVLTGDEPELYSMKE